MSMSWSSMLCSTYCGRIMCPVNCWPYWLTYSDQVLFIARAVMSFSPAFDCIVNANGRCSSSSRRFSSVPAIEFCHQIVVSLCSRKMFVSRKEGAILRANLSSISRRGGPARFSEHDWSSVHTTLAVAWEGCSPLPYNRSNVCNGTRDSLSHSNYTVGAWIWWHRSNIADSWHRKIGTG